MPKDGPMFSTVIDQKKTTDRTEASKAPAGVIDSVEDLVKKYRGDPGAIRAGIQAAIFGALAVTTALSMIPFESNFASVFAGQLMHTLVSPGVNVAVNGPIRDYLDNIFPTAELNVRLLVTGIENGSLTDEDIIDTAVDSGIKDKEIVKLLKIAKMARFIKETREDYAMIDRYEDAFISYAITSGRAEIDEAIKDRQAMITELKRIEREQAMEEVAT